MPPPPMPNSMGRNIAALSVIDAPGTIWANGSRKQTDSYRPKLVSSAVMADRVVARSARISMGMSGVSLRISM